MTKAIITSVVREPETTTIHYERMSDATYYRNVFSQMCLITSGIFFVWNLFAWPPIGSLHYIFAGMFVLGLLLKPKE